LPLLKTQRKILAYRQAGPQAIPLLFFTGIAFAMTINYFKNKKDRLMAVFPLCVILKILFCYYALGANNYFVIEALNKTAGNFNFPFALRGFEFNHAGAQCRDNRGMVIQYLK
jgi:hypothetical protein